MLNIEFEKIIEKTNSSVKYGEFVVRPIKKSDLPAVLERRNEDEVRNVMFTDKIITWEEHLAWFEKISALNPKLNFVVEYKELPFAYIGYSSVDWESRTCNTGTYAGINSKLLKIPLAFLYVSEIAASYSFEVLQMRKTISEVIGSLNKKVLEINTNYFGQILEGTLKKQVFKNNHYEDVMLLASYKEDWLLKKEAYLINNQ